MQGFRTHWFLAAGLLVVLLLLLLLPEGGDAPGPEDPPAGVPAGGKSRVEPQLATGPEPAGEDEGAFPPARSVLGGPGRPEPLGWQGVVTDGDGAPIPRARVILASWDLELDGEALFRETTSDAAGRFLVPWPEDVEWDPDAEVRLTAASPGFYCRELQLPPPGRPPAEVRLVLEAGTARLEVEVVDSRTQEPVPDVPLVLQGDSWRVEATTDVMGRTTFAGPAGRRGEVVLGAGYGGELYGPWPPYLYLDPGMPQLKRYTLEQAPRAVRVVATDQTSGALLPDATFFRVSPLDGSRQELASSGGVLDWRAPSGRPQELAVLVEAPGYLPTRAFFREDPGRPEVRVGLWPAAEGEVTIRVLQNGVPEPGAEVALRYRGPVLFGPEPGEDSHWQASSTRGTVVNASGRTDAAGLVRMPMTLPEGGLPEWMDFRILPASGDPLELMGIRTDVLGSMPWTFDLIAGTAEIVFEARRPSGEPVPGLALWVKLIPADKGSPPVLVAAQSFIDSPPNRYEGRTDETGHWRVRIPAPALFFWGYTPERSLSYEAEHIRSGEEHIVSIVEPERETISGHVVDAEGRPWEHGGVSLYLVRADGMPIMDGLEDDSVRPPLWTTADTSDLDGTFRFEGVPPGRYRILVRDFPLVEGAGIPVAAGDEDVVVRLAPPCVLRLRLADEEGLPLLIPAEFEVLRPGEHWREFFGDFGAGNGSILFPAMDQVWLAIAPEGGYAEKLLDLGRWVPGEERELVVRLERGRTIVLHLPLDVYQDVHLIVPVGTSPGDPERCSLLETHVHGETRVVLDGASRDSFTVMALSIYGEPIGLPLTIPAGEEDLELEWDTLAAQGVEDGS